MHRLLESCLTGFDFVIGFASLNRGSISWPITSMNLTRINRITNHRIFQNFTWPADLPDFARFNLIYGWNGTGKTTLSNLLRHLATRNGIDEGDAEFRVDQHAVSNANLATAPLPPVRVFNRQFIGASVFEVPTSQFSPIYFLGEDSVEKQKLIEGHKGELAKSEPLLARQQRKHKIAASDYEAFCTFKHGSSANC
jgi:wobble nucleotide-excising tRNase